VFAADVMACTPLELTDLRGWCGLDYSLSAAAAMISAKPGHMSPAGAKTAEVSREILPATCGDWS